MIALQFDANAVPPGFQALALWPDETSALLICLLVQSDLSVGGNPFVLLRETADASIYLGCLADRSGHPKTWIEIWVQNIDRIAFSWRARLEALTNAFWDRRWSEQVALLRALKRNSIIETGFEARNPLPVLIDRIKGRAIHPIEPATGKELSLCMDEAALKSAGLPSYASSLHRYLWNGVANEGTVFFAATSDAPLPVGVKRFADLFGDLHPFNPAAGLIIVRPLAPLGLIEFSDLLSGKVWAGFHSGRLSLRLGGVYSDLGDLEAIQQRGVHLFSGRSGRSGRLLEVFHLKLNLILQVLTEVRAAIGHQQLPFLALTAESFRVQLSEVGTGLPLFWSTRVDLGESVCALALKVGNGESRYFLPPELPSQSIYRPQTRSVLERGFATVRLRKVLPPVEGGTSLEATLVTDERLNVAASDLIHICLPLAGCRVDLFGKVDESQALAAGETRFRTIPQRFSESLRGAFESVAGTSIGSASFEILPLLSSPCDMYAVAVLATRILLVDEETTLPVALDEMLSLAHQVANEFKSDVSLRDRLLKIVERDPRWVASLGPQRLIREAASRDVAPRVLPAEIWWETLGAVVRLFPGIGPDSICRDFGDAPVLALDRIFEETISQIRILLLRSRSLVVADWNQNLEIHDAIYEVISKKQATG
jgi:hypothetical protein